MYKFQITILLLVILLYITIGYLLYGFHLETENKYDTLISEIHKINHTLERWELSE